MIQRIQSVWLFLAAAINVLLFFLGLYKATVFDSGIERIEKITANGNFLLLIIAVVAIALPLFAIFMYSNRKRQVNITVLSIVVNIGFVAATLMLVGNLNNNTEPAPTDGTYLPGIGAPIVAIIFLFLAMKGIRKDIKTIKSLDRLR